MKVFPFSENRTDHTDQISRHKNRQSKVNVNAKVEDQINLSSFVYAEDLHSNEYELPDTKKKYINKKYHEVSAIFG